jgi:hypothetical protein
VWKQTRIKIGAFLVARGIVVPNKFKHFQKYKKLMKSWGIIIKLFDFIFP